MGQKFEKSRKYLAAVGGGVWLASDLVFGGNGFFQTNAMDIFPHSQGFAAIAMFVANIIFITRGDDNKDFAIAQAFSSPAGALVTMSEICKGNYVTAAAMAAITVGGTLSGLKARKKYLEEKNNPQPEEALENKPEKILEDMVEQPLVVQQFAENKTGFFEKYDQLKPNLLTILGNSVFLTGCVIEMEKLATMANQVAVGVASMWVFGALCFGFSKQVNKKRRSAVNENRMTLE